MQHNFKFVLYGNSHMINFFAKAILESKKCDLVGIVTLKKDLLPLNSVNLSAFSNQHSIAYIETEDINSYKTQHEIKRLSPDIAVISWPKIIKQEVLNIPNLYSIGTHPSHLPLNRGRHPLHWFICLNIFSTTLSFFKMDEKIDNGDIILQEDFFIKSNGTINDFNDSMYTAAYNGMLKLCQLLVLDQLKFKKQHTKKATYFRKRNFFDSLIDIRMSAKSIINHVNSFIQPYNCATLIIEKNIYYIKNVQILYKSEIIIEYGKVLFMDKTYIDIKVEDYVVRLFFKDKVVIIENLSYVYTPTYYYNKYNEYWKEKLNG